MKWRRQQQQQNKSIPSLPQQRAEKLIEIGNLLRLQRQQKSLSLEKVALSIYMRRRLLQALEAGEINELPEPIYVQILINKYADFLGLNGAELASNYPIDVPLPSKRSWQISIPQLRPIHLYFLYLFVIICAINALSQSLSRTLQASNIQLEQASFPQKPTQPPLPQSQLKSVSTTSPNSNATTKPVQIDVTLKAPSWIRVVADGKIEFEGVLPEGAQRTWVANEQLTVTAGNAGGVLVTFNQEQAKRLGNPGQMQEVTFAAQRI